MSYIKAFTEIQAGDIDLVGGKGLSLGRLIQANIPVPNGFVIMTSAYKEYAKIIDQALEDEIMQAFERLGAERVAVRSSAVAEDSPGASWAGQFESYLNVDRNHVIESVLKCWESASSQTVNDYAETQSASSDDLAVAVVIQKMVESEVAGVAFSVNPISKNPDEIMIEAIYGLGELLVQGMITPDNYIVSKVEAFNVEKTIRAKSTMLVLENGENVEKPVPEEKREVSCLTDDQITELSDLVKRIEGYYGKPQDIEWAFANSVFNIVQSRPITTL